jgi:hypothetical protein
MEAWKELGLSDDPSKMRPSRHGVHTHNGAASYLGSYHMDCKTTGTEYWHCAYSKSHNHSHVVAMPSLLPRVMKSPKPAPVHTDQAPLRHTYVLNLSTCTKGYNHALGVSKMLLNALYGYIPTRNQTTKNEQSNPPYSFPLISSIYPSAHLE